jgi:hypothetical protein
MLKISEYIKESESEKVIVITVPLIEEIVPATTGWPSP